MKFKFNPNLEYQDEAISAVIDLFKGQNSMRSYFTVPVPQVSLLDSGQGIGNRLELDVDDILENLKNVQLRNYLPPSETLSPNNLNFDVEMETGTGKTYVYLKTIFELNKKYGFTKFIIVVPSIAIKEGVNKAIKMTKSHFEGLYDNVKFNPFIYDSQMVEKVRDFAVSDIIQIMIINIDSFRRSFTDPEKETKANIIHRENDKLNGLKPIELIRETNPIVIIDEPQSVSRTPKAKEAIASLNPLFTLNYSATHAELHNLIYKLDAIDAYEMGLVKQIEVASLESEDYHNKAYLKLISVDNKKSPIAARIEIDAYDKKKIKRKEVTVHKGYDLSSKNLGNREIYEGYIVNDIHCEEGNEYVNFTSKSGKLTIGEPIGDIDDLVIKEKQISKTIEEHLNKELKFNPLGIKVLSLFFIDRVANYRYYDEEGNPQKGSYAKIFEKEYKRLIKKQKYSTLLKEIDLETPVEKVHKGYFAEDKKRRFKDTKTNKDGVSFTKETEDVYNTIMKRKEFLLSFDSNLRFIFSHSALREGWDNPNVFQICTLNETKSTMKKRQEIGRGLRLCVNQEGERINDPSINTLTVMANESYEKFASELQKEIEEDEKIKFGIIQKHTFASISFINNNGDLEHLGSQSSEEIFNFFKDKGYINTNGKVNDALKIAIKENRIEVPEKYEELKAQITAATQKLTKKLDIKNLNDKKEVKLNKQVYMREDFKEFWNKIKYKTTYAVDFNSQELIEKCSKAMYKYLDVKLPKLIYTKAGLIIKSKGVESDEKQRSAENFKEEIILPDIITFLQNETNLTRRTLVNVLIKSGTLEQFKKNPPQYMEESLKIISSQMNHMIIDGIKYTKIGDNEYYAQELFKNTELFGYLTKNMLKSERSLYDYVIYDSDNEKRFAERFERDENIILYTKLPGWFKIPTPLGDYNPDWAVLVNKNDERKLFFVLETKGNIQYELLRQTEADKIECGKKHFEALGNDVEFKAVDDYNTFIENV